MSESKHVTLLGKRKHENRPDEPSAKKHEARPDGFYDWRELLGGKIDEATRLPRVLVDLVCDYFPEPEYNHDGSLRLTRCFGKQEGRLTVVLDYRVFLTGFFINDKAHGEIRTYRDDGSVCVHMYYRYGLKHGPAITYFDDLTLTVNYEDDLQISRQEVRK
jgi:hypothetical protein